MSSLKWVWMAAIIDGNKRRSGGLLIVPRESSNNTTSPLPELPLEVIGIILSFLSIKDLFQSDLLISSSRSPNKFWLPELNRLRRGHLLQAYSQNIIAPVSSPIKEPDFENPEKNAVTCIVVSLDGRRIYVGSMNNTIQVWNSDITLLRTLTGHTKPVKCLLISPDGYIYSGSYDTTIRKWRDTDGAYLQILKGHTRYVTCLTMSTDGNIYSGGDDGTVRKWSGTDGTLLHIFYIDSRYLMYGLAISPANGNIYALTDRGKLWVFSATDNTFLGKIDLYVFTNCMDISKDGNIYLGDADGNILVLDSTGDTVLRTHRDHAPFDVTCLAISPIDGRIYSASRNDTIMVWSADGSLLQTFKGRHIANIYCLAVGPNGWLYSGSRNGTFQKWIM